MFRVSAIKPYGHKRNKPLPPEPHARTFFFRAHPGSESCMQISLRYVVRTGVCYTLHSVFIIYIYWRAGIQRPLESIKEATETIYIPRGIDVPALSRTLKWHFKPSGIKVGDHVTGGDVLGSVQENVLVNHRICVPPRARGTVKSVAPEGEYTVADTVVEIEFNGRVHNLSLMQVWPVRNPRPVAEKLTADYPLLTGQRVLDALFPCVQVRYRVYYQRPAEGGPCLLSKTGGGESGCFERGGGGGGRVFQSRSTLGFMCGGGGRRDDFRSVNVKRRGTMNTCITPETKNLFFFV